MKKLSLVLLPLLGLLACNSGGGTSNNVEYTYPHNPINVIPVDFRCLPSIPLTANTSGNSTKIAYGDTCRVATISNPNTQATLGSMAIALTNSRGIRYCSGTPISYDQTTGVGYVLSAAHCVIGNNKAANQHITPKNISIFNGRNYVNQTLNANVGGTTGVISAVYVPKQYCQNPEFSMGTCSKLTDQNGDLALLKINVHAGSVMSVNNQVQLATTAIQPDTPSYILALGYGLTNLKANNTNLFYINYEYFATNSFHGETGQSVIMNGYSPSGLNNFYSLICGGDSGGGDFYWTNNQWHLIGVHSYGSSICGKSSPIYTNAADVSTDIRPFADQLNDIITADRTANGCDVNVANRNNFICADHATN